MLDFKFFLLIISSCVFAKMDNQELAKINKIFSSYTEICSDISLKHCDGGLTQEIESVIQDSTNDYNNTNMTVLFFTLIEAKYFLERMNEHEIQLGSIWYKLLKKSINDDKVIRVVSSLSINEIQEYKNLLIDLLPSIKNRRVKMYLLSSLSKINLTPTEQTRIRKMLLATNPNWVYANLGDPKAILKMKSRLDNVESSPQKKQLLFHRLLEVFKTKERSVLMAGLALLSKNEVLIEPHKRGILFETISIAHLGKNHWITSKINKLNRNCKNAKNDMERENILRILQKRMNFEDIDWMKTSFGRRECIDKSADEVKRKKHLKKICKEICKCDS